MNSIKWGILGTGTIAHEFAGALLRSGEGVYAAASRSAQKAEAFAKEFSVSAVYGGYDALLADGAIEAVYIATPHSNHYEWIIQALRQGKHVLCEKPITMNSRQLRSAAETAKEKGLILAEAMTVWHMPLYQKLRKIIKAGTIGKTTMIQVNFCCHFPEDDQNRYYNKKLAGGALLDIGVYAIALVRAFWRERPTEIVTSMQLTETGVDAQSGIILQYGQKKMAVIHQSMYSPMPKTAVIAGQKGYIEIPEFNRADRAVVADTANGTAETVSCGSEEDAMLYEIAAMKRYIQNHDDEGSLQMTMDVMHVMDEVRRRWGLEFPCE